VKASTGNFIKIGITNGGEAAGGGEKKKELIRGEKGDVERPGDYATNTFGENR